MYNQVTQEQIDGLMKLAKDKLAETQACIVEPLIWQEPYIPAPALIRPYGRQPFNPDRNNWPWDNGRTTILNTYIEATDTNMFKTEENESTLKVAMVGYSRENVSLRVSGTKLYLEAKDGGLEDTEKLTKEYTMPTDYLPDSGIVKLENGVLKISFKLKEKFETTLEIL